MKLEQMGELGKSKQASHSVRSLSPLLRTCRISCCALCLYTLHGL